MRQKDWSMLIFFGCKFWTGQLLAIGTFRFHYEKINKKRKMLSHARFTREAVEYFGSNVVNTAFVQLFGPAPVS